MQNTTSGQGPFSRHWSETQSPFAHEAWSTGSSPKQATRKPPESRLPKVVTTMRLSEARMAGFPLISRFLFIRLITHGFAPLALGVGLPERSQRHCPISDLAQQELADGRSPNFSQPYSPREISGCDVSLPGSTVAAYSGCHCMSALCLADLIFSKPRGGPSQKNELKSLHLHQTRLCRSQRTEIFLAEPRLSGGYRSRTRALVMPFNTNLDRR
ncbi:hypothetical protein B0T14DRAFT_225242 [Immersiella caudata]|uniref:Uncharacterized protein n=1 Tax=Immersiella caudata TaxID=314043 RepID=A0AA39WRL1_9PEZI|nr:hypothetical protein B0T14DRAFT_225242 [Immersiella caudata]